MDVLLPFPVQAPDGVRVLVWDGTGSLPPDVSQVELFAPPFGNGQALDVCAQLPSLRVVQALSAGVETVMGKLPDGVILCNARGVHDPATAEMALTLTLAALRRVPDLVREAGERRWSPHLTDGCGTLADAVVMILGYGSVGAAVEQRLRGFEPAEIVRVARSARDDANGVIYGFESLLRLLPRVDVVIITVPLTDETRGMVDRDVLTRLPDGALVVNVARGPVVDADALLAEVVAGRIRAAVDVTDPEPLPADSLLWTSSNLLITPHIGGNTARGLPRLEAFLVRQLEQLASGGELLNVVHGDY